ncbi:MAG: MFS transporter [Mycobacteriales bacterium]
MSRRPLRALLLADAVSVTGTAMTLLAVPWFVLQTTGSAARTGVVAACETVPLVAASALGGPLVDRLGGRRAAVASDLLSAVGTALVPLLHATTGLSFWQLCLLVGVTGFVRAPGGTARSVLLPGLAARGGTPLERATSAYDGVSRGARMVGAPLAGVLIAVLGAAPVLLVDAGTFLVSAALVRSLVPAVAGAPQAGGSYVGQLWEGLAALRADRLMRAVVAMVMVTNLVDAAWGGVLAPVYARQVLGSSVALGLLFGAFGLGALTGTTFYGALGPRLPRWPVFTVAFLLVGAPRYLLLGAQVPLPLLLAASAAVGVASGAINPVLAAVAYERVPEALRSRVLGVMSAGLLAGMPLGTALAGLAVAHSGLRTTALTAGAVYLLATLAPVVLPVWREMDSTRGSLAVDPEPQPA